MTTGFLRTHVWPEATHCRLRFTAALGRIVPNIGGPRYKTSRLLKRVAHSSNSYGAPTWVGCMSVKKYRDIALRVQRKMLISVACAYRTVLGKAV